MNEIRIRSAKLWHQRLGNILSEKPERLVFLVGSGLTIATGDTERGVWGVRDIVEHVKGRYPELAEEAGSSDGAAAYQDLLPLLKDAVSADAVDAVIRCAVLNAHKDPKVRVPKGEPTSPLKLEDCADLRDEDWHLPPAVEALAAFIHRYGKAANGERPTVLTTNFDPLIEIALRRRGVPEQTLNIWSDALQTAEPGKVAVWHVHGLWTGRTLHGGGLTADRERLVGYLQRLFERAAVVVLGYGGWQDVLLQATVESFAGQTRPPSIVWTFYEQEAQARKQNEHVFKALSSPGAMESASYFAGVDLHVEFPKLVGLGSAAPQDLQAQTVATTCSDTVTAILKELNDLPNEAEELRHRFEQAFAGEGAYDLLLAACKLLEEIPQARSERLRPQVERRMIELAEHLVTGGVPDLSAGEVRTVKGKTRFVAAYMMAVAQKRSRLLLCEIDGELRGEQQMFDEERDAFMEPSTDPSDLQFQVEQLLFRKYVDTRRIRQYDPKRDREELLARLRLEADKDKRAYFVVQGADVWQAVARELAHVSFLQLQPGTSLVEDEHLLHLALLDFLRLLHDSKETTVAKS